MYNFITILYDVFSCFGVLAKNQNTRDIRNIKNFSSHQHSLGDMFDELINIIDKEQVLSTEQRKVTFRRYEDLYVKLMHYSVFTDKTHQIIKQKYFNDIVPMILALDIRNTYRPDNEMAFYYHIHSFLTQIPDNEDDIYHAARTYLRNYVKLCLSRYTPANAHFKDIFDGVYEFIRNIRKNSTPGKTKLTATINTCKETCKHLLYLSNEDKEKTISDLDKIQVACYYLTILLAFERRTSLTSALATLYKMLISKREVSEYECQLLYLTNPIDVMNILNKYIYYFPNENSPFYTLKIDSALSWEAIDAIRDYSISDIYLYPEQKTINCVVEIENIVFGGYIYTLNNGVTLQNIENTLKDSSCHYVLNGYTEFVNCLIQLTSGKTESVHRTINKLNYEKLPFGFIIAAFAILKIAFKIKFSKNHVNIRALLNDINYFMTYQGESINLISLDHEYPESCLQNDTNTYLLGRVIFLYNSMIYKFINCQEHETNNIHSAMINNLLQEVDIALGKINNIIDSRNISAPHELANILTREKILTTREKKGNLISLFDGFTLFHCVGMITFLIHYLRTPEEKVENIFMLYGADKNNKLRRRLVYDALGIIQSQQE